MPDAQQIQQMQFGGGVDQSIFSPVVLVLILLAGILILVLPRNLAVIPFFAAGIIIPLDQILVVGALHFPMLRVLLLFGFGRMLFAKLSGKDRILTGGMNGIDKALLVLVTFTAVDGILLWRQSGEVVYQLGAMYTALGTYFLLRYLIRDEEDVKRTVRAWACVTVVVAAIMIGEQLFAKNALYMVIGGARGTLSADTIMRDGKLRATGSFQHPILAGTFGGISLPLFIGLWWKSRRDRAYAAAGVVGSITMAVCTSSSTAFMALVGGLIGLCFWPLRRNMRAVRWGIVGTLVAGQLYMTSPVWHLIFDIDFTGSSSSYHRYMLVDVCVRHFWAWALVGTKDFGTWGWMMWDLSNQYVATADTTGLIPLLSLIAILVIGFKFLGKARSVAENDKKQELLIWALAASLFANLVAFFGISYFDQTIVAWYALLAMISAATLPARLAALEPQPISGTKPDIGFNPDWRTAKSEPFIIRSGMMPGRVN
jgi:hypothetical protein